MKIANDFRYFQSDFICLAHRGGYLNIDDAPRENSLYAFKKAADIGYRYLETDVHSTIDDHLVAFHDDRLDRVTEAHGKISQLPFSYIRKARIAGIDQIPTLDEILEELPDVFLNIDIKAAGAIEPLVNVINRHKAHERVCIASFSESRLRRFKRFMGSRVATSMSTLGVAYSRLVPLLPSIVNFSGVAFQIPISQSLAGYRFAVLTKKMIEFAHSKAMKVHVWTVNDASQMRQLIRLGVDGIVTDQPAVLKRIAIAEGVWQD